MGEYILLSWALYNVEAITCWFNPPTHNFVVLYFTSVALIEHIGYRLLVGPQSEVPACQEMSPMPDGLYDSLSFLFYGSMRKLATL